MRFAALLAFTRACLCSVLGVGALYKKPHALVSRAFTLGMLVLALRETLVGLGAQATLPLAALRWQGLGWLVTTLLPGSWVLFSLYFARRNSRDFLARWTWLVGGALALPLMGIAVFRQSIFRLPTAVEGALLPVLSLGRVGAALCIVGLLSAVLILVNLEASLRASTGTKRAQIKFMLLGVGTIFAVSIYSVCCAGLCLRPGCHVLVAGMADLRAPVACRYHGHRPAAGANPSGGR